MRNLFLKLGLALVVLLAAAFSLPYFIDWTSYRATFEERASQFVGREVRVGGAVNLRLLPAPYLSFQNVRIADHDGRFGEPLLRAEAFTAWLSVGPLLLGNLEASSVELMRPELRLSFDRPKATDPAPRATPATAHDTPRVALRSVRISEGRVLFVRPGGREITRLERLNGELVADDIDGPFSFRGSFQHRALDHDLTFSTGKLEAGDGVRLKAAGKLTEQGLSYTIDGRLEEITGSPRLEGDLTAKSVASRPPVRSVPKPGEPPALAMAFPASQTKAKLKAGLDGARLTEIATLFEHGDRPQSLAGEIVADWSNEPALDLRMEARWLDLDAFAAVGESAAPGQAVWLAAELLRRVLPEAGTSRLSLSIEQARLAGDNIADVALQAERRGRDIKVVRARTSLPGAGRIETSGVLSAAPGSTDYKGTVSFRAQSINGLMTWLLKGKSPPQSRSDVPVSFYCNIAADADGLQIGDASGEIAGSYFNGTVRWLWRDRATLALVIDAERLDLRRMIAKAPGLAELLALALPADRGKPIARQPGAHAFFDVAGIDFDLKARIGQLLLPDQTLRDVLADGRLQQGVIEIRSLRLQTPEAVALQLEGRLNATEARQGGVLRYLLEADRLDGLQPALAALGLDTSGSNAARLASLLPLRLAGTLTIAGKRDSLAIALDGALKGTRISLSSRIDSDLADPLSQPIDVSLSLENPDGNELLGQLWPGLGRGLLGTRDSGRLTMRATGVLATGLALVTEVQTRSLEAGYSGTLSLAKDVLSYDGEFALKTADAAKAASLVGLKPSLATSGQPLTAVAILAGKGRKVTLKSATARIGERSFELQGTLTHAGEELAVDLKARAREASVPGLLALFVRAPEDQRTRTPGLAQIAADWPEEAIDLALFGPLVGRLVVDADRLMLGHGLAIAKSRTELEFSQARLDIKSLEGEALGGRLRSRLSIERAPAGILLNGEARIDNGRLESASLAVKGAEIASGPFEARITVSGRGLSPRGLIATLAGRGSLDLGPVSLRRLTPLAVTATARSVLESEVRQGEPRFDAKSIRPRLLAELARSVQQSPPRLIAFDIIDGALRMKPIDQAVEGGRVRVATLVDLAAMRLDSEWTLQPADLRIKTAAGEKTIALPPVSIVYSGPVAELARFEPRLDADRLEQELTIRRAERDVEVLERLQLRIESEKEAEKAAPTTPPSPPAPRTSVEPTAQPPSTSATVVVPVPAEARAPLPVTPSPTAIPSTPNPSSTPPQLPLPPPQLTPEQAAPRTLRPRSPRTASPDEPSEWQSRVFPR